MENTMNSKHSLAGGVVATALLMASGALARRGTEQSWALIAGKEPPTEDANSEVDLKEAVTWALVSGAVVGLTRLAVRRGLLFKRVV